MELHELLHRAQQNGSSARQYAGMKRVNVHQVIQIIKNDLSSGRHPAVRIALKSLLKNMAAKRWRITAGIHKGGFGGRGRKADETKHITLRVNNIGSYHLRLNKQNYIFHITGPQNEILMPWIAPGTSI